MKQVSGSVFPTKALADHATKKKKAHPVQAMKEQTQQIVAKMMVLLVKTPNPKQAPRKEALDIFSGSSEARKEDSFHPALRYREGLVRPTGQRYSRHMSSKEDHQHAGSSKVRRQQQNRFRGIWRVKRPA